MKRKLIALLLIAALLCALLPVGALAAAPRSLQLRDKAVMLNTYVGEQVQLKAPQAIQAWKSDNEKIATVTNRGLVVARGRGTATVTATTKAGRQYVCKVRSYGALVTDLQLSGTELAAGGSIKLTCNLETSARCTLYAAIAYVREDGSVGWLSRKGKSNANTGEYNATFDTLLAGKNNEGLGKYAPLPVGEYYLIALARNEHGWSNWAKQRIAVSFPASPEKLHAPKFDYVGMEYTGGFGEARTTTTPRIDIAAKDAKYSEMLIYTYIELIPRQYSEPRPDLVIDYADAVAQIRALGFDVELLFRPNVAKGYESAMSVDRYDAYFAVGYLTQDQLQAIGDPFSSRWLPEHFAYDIALASPEFFPLTDSRSPQYSHSM